MSDKNEIVLGAGEVYMMKFTGTELPEEADIETEANNVGHCSGGFTVDYKPTKYDVLNQYEQIVKSFITKEEITAKTGLLTWRLKILKCCQPHSIPRMVQRKSVSLSLPAREMHCRPYFSVLSIQSPMERKSVLQ